MFESHRSEAPRGARVDVVLAVAPADGEVDLLADAGGGEVDVHSEELGQGGAAAVAAAAAAADAVAVAAAAVVVVVGALGSGAGGGGAVGMHNGQYSDCETH